MKKFIMTVTGAVNPEKLGHCQIHEHVFIEKTPAAGVNPALKMDNAEKAVSELSMYRVSGGRSVADAQPAGAGRSPLRLKEISEASGVYIIASTGYHVPMFYPAAHWRDNADENELFELFSSELSHGMFTDGLRGFPPKRSNIKAGLVKAAITKEGVTGRTSVLLKAAGKAAAENETSLMLHTENGGEGALEAIELLERAGLSPENIIICHADRRTDNVLQHIEIAKTGVYMEYDTIGRFKYHDNESEVELIQKMLDAGFVSKLLLSLDTTAARFKSYGGDIGLDYLLVEFLPLLKSSGIADDVINQITCRNPADALLYFC